MDSKLKKFSSLLRSKKDLFKCIFLTLIFQLVISIVTVKLDQKSNLLENLFKGGNVLVVNIGLVVVMFGILFGIQRVTSFTTKQLLFGLFSILIGLLLSSTIHMINDEEIVNAAIYSTLINFVLMFAIGMIIVYFGYDLNWLGVVLSVGLLALITIQFIGMITKRSNSFYRNISYISVIIFSLYIMYDTNRILLKYQNNSENCINGALDYYLDIFNLFTNYLNINSK